MTVENKHPHYYKNVAHLKSIDVYRVLERFGVTNPSIQHAIKKLLVAGGRGAGKDCDQDVQEAINSLVRFQEMRLEDSLEEIEKSGGVMVSICNPQKRQIKQTTDAVKQHLALHKKNKPRG